MNFILFLDPALLRSMQPSVGGKKKKTLGKLSSVYLEGVKANLRDEQEPCMNYGFWCGVFPDCDTLAIHEAHLPGKQFIR